MKTKKLLRDKPFIGGVLAAVSLPFILQLAQSLGKWTASCNQPQAIVGICGAQQTLIILIVLVVGVNVAISYALKLKRPVFTGVMASLLFALIAFVILSFLIFDESMLPESLVLTLVLLPYPFMYVAAQTMLTKLEPQKKRKRA